MSGFNGNNFGFSGSLSSGGGGGGGTVMSVAVAPNNGFTGTVSNPTTTPAISIKTTVSGILKGDAISGVVSAAVVGTDYQAPISFSTTGNSGAATFVDNALNIPTYTLAGLGGVPLTRTITINGDTQDLSANVNFSFSIPGGTVTTVSVVSANGFSGSVATATSTPAITIGTTITGVLKGSGGAIVAAAAGTDYQAPISFTTTGSSGAATFTGGNALNIPNYTLAGLGGVPLTRTITINGVNQDLSADRSYTVAAANSITGTAILTFLPEDNKASIVLTEADNSSIAQVTNANFIGFSFVPLDAGDTSVDDFVLNGLNFFVSEIVDTISVTITALAGNNATGNYSIKYLILHS